MRRSQPRRGTSDACWRRSYASSLPFLFRSDAGKGNDPRDERRSLSRPHTTHYYHHHHPRLTMSDSSTMCLPYKVARTRRPRCVVGSEDYSTIYRNYRATRSVSSTRAESYHSCAALVDLDRGVREARRSSRRFSRLAVSCDRWSAQHCSSRASVASVQEQS